MGSLTRQPRQASGNHEARAAPRPARCHAAEMLGPELDGGTKYCGGGVLAPGGRIYFAPSCAPHVLCIDSATHSAEMLGPELNRRAHSTSVVDMSVKGALTLVGTLQDAANLNDAWAIAVRGNYAFVASKSMSVVDMSVKGSPYTCGDLEGHHAPRTWRFGP